MALKDPNVLNRVNTLNENLENVNIAEIERNISSRLFNVLEGANSISVDSELYASINDVTTASDIAGRIGGIALEPVININATDIRGTDPATLPHNNAADTQNSIDRIINAENDLTTLESNIANLKSRFEENIRKLTDIADEQHIFSGTVRGSTIIDNDLLDYNGRKSRINNILGILLKIIDEHNKSGGPDASKLATYKSQFDAADKTGIPTAYQTISDINNSGAITTLQGNYTTLLNTINNRIGTLGHEKNLRTYIDGLTKAKIHIPDGFLPFGDDETVASEGDNEGVTRGHITVFNNRITELNNLETQISNIRAKYAEHKKKLENIQQLQKLQERLNSVHSGRMDRRRVELETIRYISNHHLLLGNTAYEPDLPNQNINIGGNLGPINLNFIDSYGDLAPVGRTANYSLCDNSGNPLRNNGGRLELHLEGGQAVNIRGVTFDNAAQRMIINNLEISPIEGLTFPLNLDLNVRVRIHDNATGLDIDHHKPIHLEITRPTLIQADREVAYDSLVPPMNERVEAEYTDRYRENLENEAIWNILREGRNDTEVNEIYNNETRRNLFIDRIRRTLAGNIPFLGLAALQAGFRGDMTREDRDVPVQYLLNQNVFQNYLRQSIPDNLKNYATGEILNQARTHRNDILNEFLTFQTDVANGKVDNNDNLAVLAQVPGDNDGPQSHPDSWWQRLRRNRSRRNNYTKFFQGRNAELNNQTLETENGQIKYGVKVDVIGVNRIVATIDIDGKDEPEIIEAANHDRLIRGILSRANTKDGEPLNRKLRCNIALSVLKAMVMMSPQKLNREIPLTNFTNARGNVVACDRIEAFVRGENLRIRGGRVDPATHTRQNVIIFDEEQFKNLHDVHALENGVRELSTQINHIMNATAQEYQEATNGVLHNWENRNLLKYNTAQWLRGGPIKRLRGRIVHGKTNNNFDFDTSVNDAGKNVSIAYNKGKFTIAGEFDGQEYSFESRDLGSILRKKINRKRVFDGIELTMVAKINEEYVDKLRTNNLIQTENFAVADLNNDKTGKVYIFDEDGNLSYLEIEDRGLNPLGGRNAGRIDPALIPTERIRCNGHERREFFQNPLLAGRLLREMRRRLALG